MLLALLGIIAVLPVAIEAHHGDRIVACRGAAIEYYYLTRRMESIAPEVENADFAEAEAHWTQLQIYAFGRFASSRFDTNEEAQARAFDTQVRDVPEAVAGLAEILRLCEETLPRP